MSYRKVRVGDPGYTMIRACKEQGKAVCDASTHNSKNGCRNPNCWKYGKREEYIREVGPESALVSLVENDGGICEKHTSPGRKDVPDRLVIEGRGWDRAAHLLNDVLKREPHLLDSHLGRRAVVHDLIAQVIYFVECKSPGEEPTKRQRKDHERRRKLGVTVRVYDGEWHD